MRQLRDTEANPYDRPYRAKRKRKIEPGSADVISEANETCDELISTTLRVEKVKAWTWSQIDQTDRSESAFDLLDMNPDLAGHLFEAIYGPSRRVA
jgi:hypothetical protein